jgi:hypothetical protein
MKTVIQMILAFLMVTVGVAAATTWFGMELGHQDYWSNHGFLFLVFIAAFPRLTLLFSSVITGGFFWWLGWLFSPRLLVAVLATQAYWEKNPALVIASWLVAWGGETSEKYAVVHRQKATRAKGGKGFDEAKWV